jgi:hypothetical protein
VATFICAPLSLLIAAGLSAQTAANTSVDNPSEASASNDLFVMFGSDLVRPGLAPKRELQYRSRSHVQVSEEELVGDELTFSYTYENAGSHGFLHTDFGFIQRRSAS